MLGDYWQDERGAFLVMRYIRGGSLRRIMAKQDAFSLAQTIRITSDIAEALAVAHENNVVHRDLKPENILIDERGNAYLTDFGIAKRTSKPGNSQKPGRALQQHPRSGWLISSLRQTKAVLYRVK